ncbi:MAG: hypothetical protein AAGH90_08160 [Pseudomonadota bacterium]
MHKSRLGVAFGCLVAITLIGFSANSQEASKGCEVQGLSEGMAYGEARKLVIEAGFGPDQRGYEYHECIYPRMGSMAEYMCEDYPEMLSCAPTGMAPCVMTFIDQDWNRLLVGTIGEDREVEYTEYDCRGMDSEPLR